MRILQDRPSPTVLFTSTDDSQQKTDNQFSPRAEETELFSAVEHPAHYNPLEQLWSKNVRSIMSRILPRANIAYAFEKFGAKKEWTYLNTTHIVLYLTVAKIRRCPHSLLQIINICFPRISLRQLLTASWVFICFAIHYHSSGY
jgi:hypothetical protein